MIEGDGPKCVRLATMGTFAPSFMIQLAGALEGLIHEMWPGGVAAEARPYRFIVPCPTEGCIGYFNRDDLFRDLADGDEEARCNEGRRCRHDIHLLLNGQPAPYSMAREVAELRRSVVLMDGKLDDMRVGIGNILSYVSNEAPRIYSLKPVKGMLLDLRRLIQQRIEVHIWCEELNRPVPDAIETVALDKAWVKHLRTAAPIIRKLAGFAAKVGAKAAGLDLLTKETAQDLEALCDGTNQVLDAMEGVIGEGDKGEADFATRGEHHFMLERGQFVEPAVAKVLCAAAKKGGMTRIQMDDDKRWRWVCREAADRNDRSVRKEPGGGDGGRNGRGVRSLRGFVARPPGSGRVPWRCPPVSL